MKVKAINLFDKYKLIGLSGKKGSGKDEVAQMIEYISLCYSTAEEPTYKGYTERDARHNNLYIFENRKFAGPLKRMVCELIGCTESMLEDRDFKNSPLIGWSQWRVVLGTIVETFPVKSEAIRFKEFVEKRMSKEANLVELEMTPRKMLQLLGTEGVRETLHPNAWVLAAFADWEPECDWIFTDCRFPNEARAIENRGGIVIRVQRSSVENSGDMHASETALDSHSFGAYISNEGTLEDLFAQTLSVVNVLSGVV